VPTLVDSNRKLLGEGTEREEDLRTNDTPKLQCTYYLILKIKYLKKIRGTSVAQSVKHLTVDLSSGPDLRVMSSSSMLGSMLGMEPTLKKKK